MTHINQHPAGTAIRPNRRIVPALPTLGGVLFLVGEFATLAAFFLAAVSLMCQ